MVFDGDTPESPRQEKRHQGHDPNDRVENQKMNRQSSEDPRPRDQENKHLRDRDRHSVRSRGYREESSRDSQASRSGGRRSYQDYREEGRDAEKPKLRQRDTDDKLDQRESGKRYTDDGNYAERRHDGEYRKGSADRDREKHKERRRDRDDRIDQRESGKRRAEHDKLAERDDREYRKKYVDDDRRDKRDEPVHKRRSAGKDDREHRR